MSQDARLLQAGAVFSERFDSLDDLRNRGVVTASTSIRSTPRGRAVHVILNLGRACALATSPHTFGAGSFSISVWFRTDATGSSIFYFYTGATADINLYLSAGCLRPYVRDDAGTASSFTGGTAVTDSQWHHACMVVDHTVQRLYVYLDGALDPANSDITTINVITPTTWYLGGPLSTAAGGWYLETHDINIFPRALSAAEILSIYNGSVWTYGRTLVSEWDMSTV